MAKFDKGIISKEQEVIIKRTMYTDGTINTVTMGKLVRCKNCKMFYMKKDIFGKVPWCKTWHRGTIETMFCGWGRRKDGEQL